MKARVKTILVAMALLIIISLMYRYTERYNYGKDRAEEEDQEVILERDPQVARLVKERNITGEDLDRVKAFIKDPLRYS
jgi:hypothetical protein